MGSNETLPHRPFYDVDSVKRGMTEFAERWKNRLIGTEFDFAETYAQGRICIVVRVALNDPEAAIGGDRKTALDLKRLPDSDHPQDWRDDRMLLQIVEHLQNVECFTLPAWERLKRFESTLHLGGRCFYSLASGFKAGPVMPHGEVEVAVLCSVIDPNEFPRHVVEGRPRIVKSVAYSQGDIAGDFIAHLRISLDHSIGIYIGSETVRIFRKESRDLPFKILDVMIGPIDF